MPDFIPQPYPLFLAVSDTDRASEVERVIAWRVERDQDDDGPDLAPVTLIGPHAPGAIAELDDNGRLYAYGSTADEARAALAQLVDQRTKGGTR